LHGLGPIHPAQLDGFSLGRKRSPPGDAHLVLNILHQEPSYILKTINVHHRSLNLFGCVITVSKLANRPFRSLNLFSCVISVPELENHPFKLKASRPRCWFQQLMTIHYYHD
jgi:hypothetical protein